MIPPVPYAIRLPLALAAVSLALLVRTSGDVVADGLRWLADWLAPEVKRRRRR